MNASIRRHQIIVMACVNPGLKVFPSPISINMWCPGHRQWVHSILSFQNMRSIKTIFSARTWDYAVVGPIIFSKPIAEFAKLLVSIVPINLVPLPLSEFTGIADPLITKMYRIFFALPSMVVLHSRVWSLIGDNASLAIPNLGWKPIIRL